MRELLLALLFLSAMVVSAAIMGYMIKCIIDLL